jgi:hypothetical protein
MTNSLNGTQNYMAPKAGSKNDEAILQSTKAMKVNYNL